MTVTSAKQIFKNATRIDFRTLIRSNNVFNQNNFDLVKRSIDNNSASILVHPLFCYDSLYKSAKHLISGNYFVQNAISTETYTKYINNVKEYMGRVSTPIFIFYDPEIMIFKNNPYINDIKTNLPLVFVKTEPASPAPRFYGMKRSWGLLQNTFSDLEIKLFNILGEKAYIEDGNKIGCVYSLLESLSQRGFECFVDNNLIFPGITVSRHSEK